MSSLTDIRSNVDPSIPLQLTDDLEHLVPILEELSTDKPQVADESKEKMKIEEVKEEEETLVQNPPTSFEVTKVEKNPQVQDTSLKAVTGTAPYKLRQGGCQTQRPFMVQYVSGENKWRIKESHLDKYLNQRPLLANERHDLTILWRPIRILDKYKRDGEVLLVQEIKVFQDGDTVSYRIVDHKFLEALQVNESSVYNPEHDTEGDFIGYSDTQLEKEMPPIPVLPRNLHLKRACIPPARASDNLRTAEQQLQPEDTDKNHTHDINNTN